jgi:hypothetical protein
MLSSLLDRANIRAFALPVPSVIELGYYLSTLVALGGIVVSGLPLDRRFAGTNPAEDDGLLRVIKILRKGSKATGPMS